MPGKKRPTSAKTSALSKRHKPAATKKPKKRYTGPKDGNNDGDNLDGHDDAPAPARQSAFPADKKRQESERKDRKGKGPAYIEIEAGATSESEGEGSDGGMDVDEDLDDLDSQAKFLTKLDTKGLAT